MHSTSWSYSQARNSLSGDSHQFSVVGGIRWEQGLELRGSHVAQALKVASFNLPGTATRPGSKREQGIWSTLPAFSLLLDPHLPGIEADS